MANRDVFHLLKSELDNDICERSSNSDYRLQLPSETITAFSNNSISPSNKNVKTNISKKITKIYIFDRVRQALQI